MQNLDDLNMRAPLDGQLSGFDIEIGQSIDRGGRIGQIDDPDRYKLNTKIDEYYLGRIDLKQVGVANHNGRDFAVEIAKIYPQVNNGQFEVDMTFAEEPVGVRRGQTLQLELTLGDNSDAILIPNGTFYQETGGNWVFVVSPDGSEASPARRTPWPAQCRFYRGSRRTGAGRAGHHIAIYKLRRHGSPDARLKTLNTKHKLGMTQ